MIISLTFNRTAKNVLTNYCFMLFHKKKKLIKSLSWVQKKILIRPLILYGLDKFD